MNSLLNLNSFIPIIINIIIHFKKVIIIKLRFHMLYLTCKITVIFEITFIESFHGNFSLFNHFFVVKLCIIICKKYSHAHIL